jgi:hypothetical protein
MNRSLCTFSLVVLSFFFFHSEANAFTLDEVMPKEVQQKAGINKLSVKEKIELENWLNQTFVLKMQKVAPTAELSLSININSGRQLQLSDKSIWEIAPGDVPTSSVWITPFPVKIVPSNDPDYPFLIVNSNSGVSVKAKKVPPPEMTPTP